MQGDNKSYCMSEYLMYRYLYDETCDFVLPHRNVDISKERVPVGNSEELLHALETVVKEATKDGKAALALSGGMDSAILARMMPEGSLAYTFRCIVPGKKLADEFETEHAAQYAKECRLEHRVIDIEWKDVEACVDELMRHKGAPIHSIETQIYIASKIVRENGFQRFIFGEIADATFGGLNGLLAKDWLLGEFIDRYSYVLPYKVLRHPEMPLAPFYEFLEDGHIDGHSFINKYFRQESLGSYTNACGTAGIEFVAPYARTSLSGSLDLERVRNGEAKYIIREAYERLYPGWDIPAKIPMPRPVNEWFADWDGPTREEFLPHCAGQLDGNQRWMVWCLERYLDLLEKM